MGKIVVTAGDKYTDIDVLACTIAYSELLSLEGKTARAVLLGPFQNSITSTINSWQLNFSTQSPIGNNKYVIVDCSDPIHFSKFVQDGQIIEIFDHHAGFINVWKEKLGSSAHIELIGACATLIWEEFKKRRNDKNISSTSAGLLYTAIASNTLYFKASVTSKRDKKAYKELQIYTDLPDDWIENYFTEQEKAIYRNPELALKKDMRNITDNLLYQPLNISQIELWNSRNFVMRFPKIIERTMSSYGSNYWFLTAPSIK